MSPDDRRYHIRLERYRRYVPPPSAAEPALGDPFPRSPASLAAERVLRRIERAYYRVPLRTLPVRVRRQRWNGAKWLTPLALTALATGLLPVALAWLFLWRPDLRGRALREALPRPADWAGVLGLWWNPVGGPQGLE